MTLVERKITVAIQLGKGTFGESGFDTVTLSGYRCSVEVDRAALPYQAQATVQIFGMSQSLMNQLSTLGGNPAFNGRLNILTITAGDDQAGMFQIFEGVINNGYQDYGAMPDVCFVAIASSGGLDLVKPATATSFPGSPDVATILKGMAARMTPPLGFQNYGVSGVLTNPYFNGCLLDQIRSVTIAANINGEIHNGTLYIWPRNGARPVAPTPISPATGLVGYPSINGVELFELRTVFNPLIDFGSFINLQSSLKPACGIWYINGVTHLLDSVTPGGSWFTDMEAASKDYITAQPAN